MEMTIKCPNCNQKVPYDSVYCEFCGVKIVSLADERTSGDTLSIYSGGPETPAAPMAPVIPETPAPYDGPQYCPAGHHVENPSLGFCPECGELLVDAPGGAAAPVKPEPKEVAAPGPVVSLVKGRTCRNGHTFNDPDLYFCPECGVSYDEPEPAEDVTAPVRSAPEPVRPAPEAPRRPVPDMPAAREDARPDSASYGDVPEGMFVPGADALRRRRK